MRVFEIKKENETPAPAPKKLKEIGETEYEKRKRAIETNLRFYEQPKSVGVVISEEELSRI